MTRASALLSRIEEASAEFSHTYKLSTKDMLAFFADKDKDKKYIVSRGKELWQLYINGTKPEHVLTFNTKTGEVFTDMSLDQLPN